MIIQARPNLIFSPVRNTYNYIKHTIGHTHYLPRKTYEQVAREDPYGMKDVSYDLDSDSLVLDIGGYTGGWAMRMYCLYSCYIDIYEPHPVLSLEAKLNFLYNSKVPVFTIALGSENGIMSLYGNDMSASLLPNRMGRYEHKVVVKRASDLFKEKYSGRMIDLMKMNIEGAEYGVLPDIMNNFGIDNIKNINISFHNNVQNYKEKMAAIRNDLSKTHEKTWGYDYWAENWRLK
jgi:FkbM family methyltransferase